MVPRGSPLAGRPAAARRWSPRREPRGSATRRPGTGPAAAAGAPVLLQMEAAGDSPDDRVQDAVARSAPVRAYVDAVWPELDPRAGAVRAARRPILAVRRRAACRPPSSRRCCAGPAAARPRSRRAGARRTPSSSTKRPTSSNGRRASATSWSTRRRTCHPCSCARRTALLDRVGDGARRPRAGDDAVGHRRLGVDARAPRQAGGGARGARPRVSASRNRSSPWPRLLPLDGTGAGGAVSVRQNPGRLDHGPVCEPYDLDVA